MFATLPRNRFPTAAAYASLVKLQLCLFVALSGFWGYVLYRPQFTRQAVFTTLSILSLACGAAVWNNVQDRQFDRRFSRTRKRPLPAGRVSVPAAKGIAAIHIAFGLFGLGWSAANALPLLLGVASLVLYNGIYTPLKKRTVLSIFPGAVCGMLPPYIGWLAAGGSGFTPVIGSVMLIVGLWQFPHFWLVLVRNDTEFSKLPHTNMLQLFSPKQLRQIQTVWVGAIVAAIACLPLVYRFRYEPIFWAVYALGLFALSVFLGSSFRRTAWSGLHFLLLNALLLALMAGMICDRLL